MLLRISCFGLLFVFVAMTSVADDNKEALKPLQGDWVVKEIKAKGQPQNAPDGNPIAKIGIKGNVMSVNGKKLAKITVDPSTTPNLIDFEVITDGANGKKFEGIYKIKGKTFTICVYVGENNNRPTSFQLGDDTKKLILLLKRDE